MPRRKTPTAAFREGYGGIDWSKKAPRTNKRKVARTVAHGKTIMVMRDIDDYRSPITGETITSRSKHREHLKQHGCEEVGTEMPKWLREKKRMRAEGQDVSDFHVEHDRGGETIDRLSRETTREIMRQVTGG